jgi:hypothetical protein
MVFLQAAGPVEAVNNPEDIYGLAGARDEALAGHDSCSIVPGLGRAYKPEPGLFCALKGNVFLF